MSSAPFSDGEAPWELLARHLAGEATAAELDQLRQWVVGRPERLGLLTDATRAWERVGGAAVPELFSEADVEAAWQRFRPHMLGAGSGADAPPIMRVLPASPEATAPVTNTQPLRQPLQHMWLRVAAVLLLLVGVVFLFRSYRARVLPELPPVAVAAGAAKRLVALPDGSQVWLNRNSRLSYAARFDSGRVVRLVGEAFFEVQKDAGRPFTVLSATSRTRVLGTSFNVRAYPHEDSVEVAVVTGRVAVAPRQAATDSVLLTPGLRTVVRAVARRAVPLRAAPTPDANFRAWQTEKLQFDNAPVGHVVRTLRTTYGTSITVADPALLACRFTGSFQRSSAEEVLRVVSIATNATLAGNSAQGYTLHGAGCPQ